MLGRTRQKVGCDESNSSCGDMVGNEPENACCAECGVMGDASLKMCKACMLVKYCNAECQHKHWPKHKKHCKQRAAEMHDEALFKDPPPKEDCPICFLPMPSKLICCVSLPPATLSFVPICEFSEANKGLAGMDMDVYYPCCGKRICEGCIHSFNNSGNNGKCPFCNAERIGRTDRELVADMRKRVAANDAASIYMLGYEYYHGSFGLQQDQTKAIELFTKSAELGCSKAHVHLGMLHYKGGDMRKAKYHYEAAAGRTRRGTVQPGNLGNTIRK